MEGGREGGKREREKGGGVEGEMITPVMVHLPS